MRVVSLIMAILIAALSPAMALAACAVPAQLTARAEGPSSSEPRRLLPIGGYTLALIWLPERCRNARDFGCAQGAGKQGFALHGLWPDGRGADWPQWCKPAAPLPAATLGAHYCATPSAQLTQHEWAKHGTCIAGATPDRFLAQSRALFDRTMIPRKAADWSGTTTAIAVQRAVAAANPGMRADMMRLNVNRNGWLEEVWLCLDTRFRPQRCPRAQGGAAGAKRIRIQPLRG